MSAQPNAPVIIKRKKVIAGGGHHGGAWKVAYADFVTAMMAFFMLMWLLNATTEKQRKGIADYFNPTIPVNRISGGGEGSFGGTNIFSEQTLAKNGTGASQRRPTEQREARGSTGTDAEATKDGSAEAAEAGLQATKAALEEMLTGQSGDSDVSPEIKRHIVLRVTDEGLIVELFDLPDVALFDGATDTPRPILIALTRMISGLFLATPNLVAVEGHVSAEAIVRANRDDWGLSMDRAARVRNLMELGALAPGRFDRVTGHADREPAARNPMAPRNNRIEIILLR